MKKVLMVSYLFPPFGGIGTLRMGKLAKYLPQFGWEPVVLTADVTVEKSHTLPIEIKLHSLPVEIDESEIVRTPCFLFEKAVVRMFASPKSASSQAVPKASFWSRAFNKLLPLIRVVMGGFYKVPILGTILPEPVGWYPYAVKTGLEILRKGDIDVIFSSANPMISHFVASRLHKKTGIPWVAEFRDLRMTYTKRSQLFKYFDRMIEKKTIRGSNILISVSEPVTHILALRHSKKAVTIHNGFDEADYLQDVPSTSKFTLIYTGNIYVGRRDPTPLFEAMAELQKEGKLSPDNLEVRFFGGSSLKTFLPLIEKYRLEKLVRIYDSVPFKESVRKQQESSALLLLEWTSPRAASVYSGKLFEYLGARRPILAIAYKAGVINELLTKSGCGKVVTGVEEIKVLLKKWLEELREYGEITSYYNPNAEVIKLYTRREGAKKLAAVFDVVTNPSRDSTSLTLNQ